MSEHYGLNYVDGARLFTSEKYGDWYRDPWGWPEITWAGGSPDRVPTDELVEKTAEGIIPRIAPEFKPLNVPKSLLGHRPAVVMSADARLLYLSAIAPAISRFHNDLPDWAYGWRARNGRGLTKNKEEWQAYVAGTESISNGEYVLQADITSFFASVPADRVIQEVFDRLGSNALATVTASIVKAHDSLSAHSGLPQRSWGSAILANMYLRPIDDAISQRLGRSSISNSSRWMDDLLASGKAGDLYSLNLDIQDRARQLGLELNSAKSHLRPADVFLKEFNQVVMRDVPMTTQPQMASGGGPASSTVDKEWLLAKEEEILADPDSHDRSVIRFVLRNLRGNELFQAYGKWLVLVHKIPHLADYVGRYLRDAAHSPLCSLSWATLQDWFSAFVSSPWSTLPWVRAQIGLIFDSSQANSSTMREIYRGWLESSEDLQLIAVAVHRLGVIDPSMVRDIIRGRLDNITSPLTLRVMGLGLMAVEEERTLVESVLRRDPRNVLVCSMFDDRGFRAPHIASDFDGPGE